MPRPPRPMSRLSLERAALHYLGRYAASAETLRRVLARKALRQAEDRRTLPPDMAALIEDVVARAVRSGLLDDARYADTKVASLLRRGTSVRQVRSKLRERGVDPALAEAALAEAAPDETALARRHAERRRLGPFRPNPDPTRHARDLAALVRAGFSPRSARAALAEPDGEAEE